MPIAAKQLLMSGVTTVRDLGARLEDILPVRERIAKGEIPGPRVFASGPFLQRAPYEEYEKEFRWGVNGAADARTTAEPNMVLYVFARPIFGHRAQENPTSAFAIKTNPKSVSRNSSRLRICRMRSRSKVRRCGQEMSF
jgi:hypothetical protein